MKLDIGCGSVDIMSNNEANGDGAIGLRGGEWLTCFARVTAAGGASPAPTGTRAFVEEEGVNRADGCLRKGVGRD